MWGKSGGFYHLVQPIEKLRKGDSNALAFAKANPIFGSKTRHREGHRNAVVAVGFDLCATKPLTARNAEAVRELLNLDVHPA